MPSDSWYENRFSVAHEWVFAARDALVESFKIPEMADVYRGTLGGDPCVLLCGQTQVGKTELLLKLLGLDLGDESRKDLKECLRGGRRNDESSTATACFYSVQPENLEQAHNGPLFFLHSRGRTWRLSSHQLKTKLQEIRAEVESGRVKDTDAIHIELPRALLREEPSGRLQTLRVIDLPGTGGENPQEQAHLERLKKRYGPLASAIIEVVHGPTVVTSVSDEAVERLTDDPGSIRIVLTRALSPDDVRQRSTREEWDLPQVRNYYAQELGDGWSTDMLYPLEYGDSWAGCKLKYPAVHQRFSPQIEEEMQRLVDGLPDTDAVTATLDLRKRITLAEARAKRHWSVREKSICLLQDEITSLGEHLAKRDRELERLRRKKGDLKPGFIGVPGIKGRELPESTNTVSAFQKYISERRESLCKQVREFCLKYDMPQTSSKRINKVLDENFSDFEKRLEGYGLDGYWPSVSASLERDKKTAKQVAAKATSAVQSLLSEEAGRHRRELERRYRRKRLELNRLIDKCLKDHALTRTELTEKSILVDTHEQRFEQWKRLQEEDLETARRCGATFTKALDDWAEKKLEATLDDGLSTVQRLESALDILIAVGTAEAHGVL